MGNKKPPEGGINGGMEPWLIALIVKPIVFLAVCYFVLWPARKAVERLPDGRLRRLLLYRVQKSDS